MVVNLRESQPPVPLDKFCQWVEAGDSMWLSGSSKKSRAVGLFSWCEWTHVGMIDEDPSSGLRFLWESQRDADDCIDALSRSARKTGPKLVELRERLSLYARTSGIPAPPELVGGGGGGEGWMTLDVAVKRLCVASPELRARVQKKMSEFESLESRKAFERSRLDMVRAQYSDFLGASAEDTSSYFCSELVVATYKFIKALPSTKDASGRPLVNASAETPSGLARSSERFKFCEGFSFGPELFEIRVLIPPIPVYLKKEQ